MISLLFIVYPWLCKATQDINLNAPPTGEIDFIILHPNLGGLLLEIKGDAIKSVEGSLSVKFLILSKASYIN